MTALLGLIGADPDAGSSVDPYGCIWGGKTCTSLQYQYTANSMTFQSAITFLIFAAITNACCGLLFGKGVLIYQKLLESGCGMLALALGLLVTSVPRMILLPCSFVREAVNSDGTFDRGQLDGLEKLWLELVENTRLSWWFDKKNSIRVRTLLWPVYFIHLTCTLLLSLCVSMAFFVYGFAAVGCVIAVNGFVFVLALSNADFNFHVYGTEGKEYAMTISGMLAEDLPQFVIQLGYAVSMANRYGQAVSTLQWVSFSFTIWRFGYSFLFKTATLVEDAEKIEHQRPYLQVTLESAATGLELV